MRIGTVVAVLFILWLALKSPKIILAVFVDHADRTGDDGGAFGLWMVGAFNPISIAFAVLFVGIGVDFGIQFSVRYRAERYEVDDLAGALANAARNVGVPLTLAAAATAAGFFSFLPTAYGGFSELGAIAGVGMIIAYVDQHHAAAGAAGGAQSAGRAGAAGLPVARAGRPFHRAPPRSDHRRHVGDRRSAACRCCISCSSTSTR